MMWNCECALPMGMMPMLLDRYLGLPGVDWAGIESTRRSAKLMASGDDR